MKRIFLTVAATAGIAALTMAQSPVSFGVRAGLNINSLSGDGAKDLDSKIGFNVGATVGYGFTDMLGLQSGLLLNTRGAQMDKDGLKVAYSIYELQLPVFFTGTFALNDDLKIKANVGPTFGVGLSAKGIMEQTGKDKVDKDLYEGGDDAVLKRFNLGVAAGVGAEFRKIYLGVGYDLGVTDINNQDGGKALKTGSFTINVGYTF